MYTTRRDTSSKKSLKASARATVTRVFGRDRRGVQRVPTLADLQSECNTLVDFSMDTEVEDDNITLWGGNEDTTPSSWRPSGFTNPGSRRSSSNSKTVIDRSQMLDPEDRTWDLPRPSKPWAAVSARLSRSSSSQARPQTTSQNYRGLQAEDLDIEERSWM